MKKLNPKQRFSLHETAAFRCLLLGLAFLTLALVSPAGAADPRFEIGITGAWLELDVDQEGRWAGIEDGMLAWPAVTGDLSPGLQLSGISLRLDVDSFAVVALWERNGPIDLWAQRPTNSGTYDEQTVSLSSELNTIDVRLEKSWRFGQRFELLGRVGMTRLQVEQGSSEVVSAGGLPLNDVTSTSSFVGWGAVVGGRITAKLSEPLTIFADLNLRWARGTWDQRVTWRSWPIDPGSWELIPGGEPVENRGHGEVDRTLECFAADLGLRWRLRTQVAVEAGWHLKDWPTLTPGSYSGPFVRLLLGF